MDDFPSIFLQDWYQQVDLFTHKSSTTFRWNIKSLGRKVSINNPIFTVSYIWIMDGGIIFQLQMSGFSQFEDFQMSANLVRVWVSPNLLIISNACNLSYTLILPWMDLVDIVIIFFSAFKMHSPSIESGRKRTSTTKTQYSICTTLSVHFHLSFVFLQNSAF